MRVKVNYKRPCLSCYCSSCLYECTCNNKAMEEGANKYSLFNLQSFSYRHLQQIAKSMNLPSNVKKMYLIELINAKKFKTSRDLNELIHRVKLERKHQAIGRKAKKIRVQGAEISSTSNSSPPITHTPKRYKYNTKHSPDTNPTGEKSSNPKVYPPSVKSDRVLRSFRDRPNYRIMNSNNTLIGVIKAQSPKTTKINIVSRGTNCPKFNVTAIVKKHTEVSRDGQLMAYDGSMATPRKQRQLSGISPLTSERSRIITPTVNFTRRDGRTSKINALVHKPQTSCKDIQSFTYKIDDKSQRITEYDSINRMIQEKIETTYGEKYQDAKAMDNEYLHKKIRAEHMRSAKVTQICTVEERLPCINDVFSKFNDANLRRLMQPIHVEVSTESERMLNFPPYMMVTSSASLLERLYNFRSSLLSPQPLLRIAPLAHTKCVYSTPTISSTMQQPTAIIVNEYNPPYQQDNSFETISTTTRISDYVRAAENEPYRRIFTCNEVLSSSPSSLGSGRLRSGATIPEMVEDAFELISQDGDYMERIGLDERMQCFLCSWAGPKFILEHHIRKDHPSDIECAECGSCRVRLSLGGLAGGVAAEGGVAGGAWTTRVISQGGRLIVLSAKYEDPHHFMAALHTLTEDETPKFGKMTIYNKVTGEPYVWEGQIKDISDSITRDQHFKLDLSRMNLLPNSANLMLINRELVVMSPSRVVVGSPALHDIYIELFIQIWGQ